MTTTEVGGATERVLATLNADGSRRWLKPWLTKGAFWKWRRLVAYGLIALFISLPYIPINGKPAVLLDLPRREFTMFGFTFLPTDTALMAVLMMIIFFTIFLVTALFGRVWCGWACPQTVYMEFLFRPLERLFEGDPRSRRKEPLPPWKKLAKWASYLVACMFLAHIFLAYFVGVDSLAQWVTQSPFHHPAPFFIMVAVTGLMMFDFCFFREQACLVACPYGRLQAAMLDQHSLIVTYDESRGEPRGVKKRRKGRAQLGAPSNDVSLRVLPDEMGAHAAGEPTAARSGKQESCTCGGACKTDPGSCSHATAVQEPATGDCVDCNKCVTTCPTGIDIRDGLQLECIGCAQCIDACNDVMAKLGREPGLIRYSSRAIVEGAAKSIVRPRTILYPSIVLGLVGLWLFLFLTRQDAQVRILPRQGATHYELPNGDVSNQIRMRVVNRGAEARGFTFGVAAADASGGFAPVLLFDSPAVEIQPVEPKEVGFQVSAPAEAFGSRGKFEILITVSSDDGTFEEVVSYRMLGPVSSRRRRGGAGDEGSAE